MNSARLLSLRLDSLISKKKVEIYIFYLEYTELWSK